MALLQNEARTGVWTDEIPIFQIKVSIIYI